MLFMLEWLSSSEGGVQAHNKLLQVTFDPPPTFAVAKAGIASCAPDLKRYPPSHPRQPPNRRRLLFLVDVGVENTHEFCYLAHVVFPGSGKREPSYFNKFGEERQ